MHKKIVPTISALGRIFSTTRDSFIKEEKECYDTFRKSTSQGRISSVLRIIGERESVNTFLTLSSS